MRLGRRARKRRALQAVRDCARPLAPLPWEQFVSYLERRARQLRGRVEADARALVAAWGEDT